LLSFEKLPGRLERLSLDGLGVLRFKFRGIAARTKQIFTMTDNIPNRGPELLGVNWFFAISALLAVLMRCYVRIGIVKKFGLDDWMMAAATVCDGSHRLFLFSKPDKQ
jgi:hypothetical protein